MAKVQIDNATVLATIKPVKGFTDYFSGMNKVWHPAFGSKLTAEMITAAVWLTSKYRSPGIECLHIAMCLRPEGCTVQQYTNAGVLIMNRVVGPANNKRKAIVASGLCSYTVEGKPYAFKLNFTDKGVKFIASQVAAVETAQVAAPVGQKAAKASKPVTGKAKAKKATKVAPAETPTSEAATVTVTPTENQVTEQVTDSPFTETAMPVTETDLNALAEHFNG